MEINYDLSDWLDGRTVGYSDIFGGWYWRGSGYDDGWVQMDKYDVRKLRAFLSLM